MRFLVDQPVSPILAEWLRSVGHDAYHVRDRGLSRAADELLFQVAISEERVIVTSDLDFSRIIALGGYSRPGLILFRGGNATDAQMLEMLRQVIDRVPEERLIGAVSVVDRWSCRVTPLPLRPPER